MCSLGCIEGLLRYFNQYAFTQVAIYGKSYCNAGRVCPIQPNSPKMSIPVTHTPPDPPVHSVPTRRQDTFALFGRVGMDAVANDSLVRIGV